MYKIRNKKLALLMTLIFVLTIMLPLAGPASAATSYSSLGTPAVAAGGPAQNLGTLFIKVDPMAAGATTEAVVSLPTDFVLTAPVAVSVPVGTAATYTVTTGGPYTANEFKIEIDNSAVGAVTEKIEVTIPLNATVPSGFSGDITAKVTSMSGQLTDGEVVVGTVPSAAVDVSVVDPDYLADGDTVTFTIKENAAGALKMSGTSLKFTLPKGFSWRAPGTVSTLSAPASAPTFAAIPAPINVTNDRVMELNVTAVSTAKGIIRVAAVVDIDEIDAKHGEVEVTLGGTSSVSPSKVAIGTYADFGFETSVEDVPEILAGRFDVEIGDIVIEETAPASLVPNRTILLTLPKGAKWETLATANLDLTRVTATAALTFSNSDRTAKIVLGAPATTKAGKIVIEDATVNTAVNFSGDLKVKIEGSAGVTGELVVAEVKAPIAVSADDPNVKIGIQAQAAGDIIITEGEAEALINNKTLTITPVLNGVTFDATPEVEVTEGDLEVTLTKTANQLTLEVDGESTTASTIKISGITLTVDRSVPEGNLELNVRGLAVDEVNDPAPAAAGLAAPLFDQDRNAAKVVNAICVTPAPGEAKQDATFVIGSTSYTVNGVEQTMDVAPYVKQNRTYLPLRYAGYALGVSADNIFWDGKTATLLKGDKVVQVTVGSKAMVVNGATINMDVAPELTNDRTMLPFRWIAIAFGAAVDWDQDTQTVTMGL